MLKKEITYSSAELAKIVGKTRKTILNWTSAGKIKGYRTPGGHMVYKEKDVLPLLHSYIEPEKIKSKSKTRLPRKSKEEKVSVVSYKILSAILSFIILLLLGLIGFLYFGGF